MADGLATTSGLKSDKLFQLSLLTPIFIGLTIAIVICINESYVWRFDSTGFKNFYDFYKFPILVSGLCLPISGLYAAIFRSQQTQHQIETALEQSRIAKEQNHFQNHFKHLEEFLKYFEQVKNKQTIYVKELNRIDARALHFGLFPNTADGILAPNEDIYLIPQIIHDAYRKQESTSLSFYTELLKMNSKIFEILDIDFCLINPLMPVTMKHLCLVIDDCMKFNGLNNKMKNMANDLQLIDYYSTHYFTTVRSITRSPVEKTNEVLTEGIKAPQLYPTWRTINKQEDWIIGSAFYYIFSKSKDEFDTSIDQLTSSTRNKILVIFEKSANSEEGASLRTVSDIINHMKTLPL